MIVFKPGDIVYASNDWAHTWNENTGEHNLVKFLKNMLVIAVEPVYDRDGDEEVQNLTVLLDGEEWTISSTNVSLVEENLNA